MSAPDNIKSNYNEVLPGMYEFVPNEVYHASDGLSSTNIKDIYKSIDHYKLTSNKQTDAMIKGSALHDLVLLPDIYKDSYIVSPIKDRRTKAYKQFVLDNSDKQVITLDMSDDIHRMRDSLYKNPTIVRILDSKSVLREVSMWAKDIDTNLLLKARPDLVHEGIIYDLKSTISPSIRGFLGTIYKFKYHVSDAYYRHVCQLNGLTIDDFQFIVVGSTPPYSTAIYKINSDLLGEGVDIYKQSLLTYSNYLLSEDKWSGLSYGREVVTL